MNTRRGFMGAMLAACAAPAFVRAESLMKLSPAGLFVPVDSGIITPEMVTREALRILHANLSFISTINTEWESNKSYRSIVFKRPAIYRGPDEA